MRHLLSCVLALVALACAGKPDSHRALVTPATPIHGTSIVTPDVLRGLPIGPPDHAGRPTVTPCATCHGTRDASALPGAHAELAGPHRGLTLAHGELACAACHDAGDRGALHLADGRVIPLVEAMTLCAQCHGPQKRDYDHGAHGGMRGHWDLSRGPRERNHCVACHDPHAPRFGTFSPAPGPRDRFTQHEESARE